MQLCGISRENPPYPSSGIRHRAVAACVRVRPSVCPPARPRVRVRHGYRCEILSRAVRVKGIHSTLTPTDADDGRVAGFNDDASESGVLQIEMRCINVFARWRSEGGRDGRR